MSLYTIRIRIIDPWFPLVGTKGALLVSTTLLFESLPDYPKAKVQQTKKKDLHVFT